LTILKLPIFINTNILFSCFESKPFKYFSVLSILAGNFADGVVVPDSLVKRRPNYNISVAIMVKQ